MFKYLSFAAALVCSSNAIEILDDLTCTTTLADMTTFQLKDLKADGGYLKTFANGNYFQWNYCQAFSEEHGEGADTTTVEYYAALDVAGNDIYYGVEAIKTDGKGYSAILAEDGKTVNGVEFTQNGQIKCLTDNTRDISFTTKLTCDESITSVDVNKVDVTVSEDKCNVTAAFAHKAGCPTVDITDITDKFEQAADDSLGWLYENEWAIGIIYLVAGPLIALFGATWFPYIVASLVAIFTIGLVCMVSMTAGWMAGSIGTAVTCSVALVLGVVIGCVVRRNFKMMLGLLGLIFGFFSGSLLFALISGMTGG